MMVVFERVEEKERKKKARRQRSRSFFGSFEEGEKKDPHRKRVCDPRACRPLKLLLLTLEAEEGPSLTCRTRDKSPDAPDEAVGAWATCADVVDDVFVVSASKPLTRTAGGATAATAGEPRHVGLLSDDEGVTLALPVCEVLFALFVNERAALAARRLEGREGSEAWFAEPGPNSSFAVEELGLTKGTTELF